MKNIIKAAAAAILMTTAAYAHDYQVGGLTVMHPKAFETAKKAKVGGGYMAIENSSDSADVLIAVRVADIPRVEMHLSQTDANGVARMIKQEGGIPIPAGETVILQPGGLHVMFMGLGDKPFEAGQEVEATLVFQKAGELEIVFNIEARSAADHGAMKHSGDMESN